MITDRQWYVRVDRFLENRDSARTIPVLVAVTLFSSAVVRADGVIWEGGITTILQDADSSRFSTELTASADLFLTLPRDNGEWLLYIEASTAPESNGVSSLYPTANADAGSVLNRDGDGSVQVSEFHYTFHLATNQRLMLGLVNPSAWLDRSRIANDENTQFLNGSFKNNATIEFPDYTPGAIMRWLESGVRPEIILVATSSDGIGDLPGRSYRDLFNLSADQRRAFLGAEASWLRERTTVRLGAWLRSDDHLVAGRPDEFVGNYGVYTVFGWQASDSALNFRLGAANEDVSVATHFAAAAFQQSTRIGLLGLGLARTRISNGIRQADLDDVSSAEIFLRIPVGDTGVQITPSLQYVQNPGFDAAGATASSSAMVAGVRFHWSAAQH